MDSQENFEQNSNKCVWNKHEHCLAPTNEQKETCFNSEDDLKNCNKKALFECALHHHLSKDS
jgi:hypothetical protein